MDGSEFYRLGATPISSDSSCGYDLIEEPSYAKLRSMVRCLEEGQRFGDLSPVQSEQLWGSAVQLARSILSEHSKDLIVAVYMATGLVRTDRYSGFVHGLEILYGMLETYGEQLFPREPAGRKNAISGYLDECAGVFLGGSKAINGDELGAMERGLKLLHGLPDRAEWMFPKENQGVWPRAYDSLLDGLTEIYGQHHASQRAPGGESGGVGAEPDRDHSPPVQKTDSAAHSVASKAEEISSDTVAASNWEAVVLTARRVSEYYRSRDLRDPISYRILRSTLWAARADELDIQYVGKNRVPVLRGHQIPKEIEKKLAELHQNHSWEPLVRVSESWVAERPFWLQAHWYSMVGLEGLGEEYRAAANAIIGEVAAALRRYPLWPALHYDEKRSLAGPARNWAEGLLAVASDAGRKGQAESLDLSGEDVAEWPHGEPTAGGDMHANMVELGQMVQTAEDERSRFRRRLALAMYAHNIENASVLVHQLRILMDDIDARELDGWEHALSVAVARLACEALPPLAEGARALPIALDLLDRARSRLSRLAPAALIDLPPRR